MCIRDRVWAEQAWAEARPRRIALFRVPGVSILTARGDLLRAKRLAMDAYFYASVVAYLVVYVLPDLAEENNASLWAQIRSVDRARGTHKGFANLRLSM
eukprot:6546735-Alexandrium_andersonii.AAC.1